MKLNSQEKSSRNKFCKPWKPDKIDGKHCRVPPALHQIDKAGRKCVKYHSQKAIRKTHEDIWTLQSMVRVGRSLDKLEMWLPCNYTYPLLVSPLSYQIFYQNSGSLLNSYINQDQSINPLNRAFCQITLFCWASNQFMWCCPPLADKLMLRIIQLQVIFSIYRF